MEPTNQTLSALLLPMNGFQVILPQATVMEVADAPEMKALPGPPQWLRGVFDWRSEEVPLISFESMCGTISNPVESRGRIAVLYALEGLNDLLFYGFELQAIPRPVMLRSDMLAEGDSAPIDSEMIATQVMVANQPGVIPDLKAVEYAIHGQLNELCGE